MSILKTRAIVLRTIDLREADRIIELYTDQYGKLRAVARGIRKISSRLAGHLEPFTDTEVMLAEGRGDLPTITGAKAVCHYAGLRRDLAAVAAASYVAELVCRLTPDQQPSRRFPVLLRECLQALDRQHDSQVVARYFEWRAIQASGWEPDLRHCALCHRQLSPHGLAWSFAHGGVLCSQCRVQDPAARAVSADALKVLRLYAEQPFSEAAGVLVTTAVQRETRKLVDQVVSATLEREPKSRAFLNHLETA